MDITKLGGVFKVIQDYADLPQELKDIYDQFTADPTKKLKLTKHPEYYGPVIADYTKNQQTKHSTLLWMTDPLTLRFFHSKNPKVNLFEMALNLGDFELAKQQHPSSYNLIKNNIPTVHKIDVLLELKEPLDKIFEKAIVAEDLSGVKYCMQLGIVIDRNKHKSTLKYVLENGCLEIVQHFEECGIAINSYDTEFIENCLRNKHKKVFEFLYNKAKSYPIPNSYGVTQEYLTKLIRGFTELLVDACDNRDLETIKYYIDLGVDVNGHMAILITPIQKGHFDVVKLLVESGADTTIDPGYHTNPLLISMECRRYDISKFLLENDATGYIDTSTIIHAPFELVKLLLEKRVFTSYTSLFIKMCGIEMYSINDLEYIRINYDLDIHEISGGFLTVINNEDKLKFDYLLSHFQFSKETMQLGFLNSLRSNSTEILQYFLDKGYDINRLETEDGIKINDTCLEYLIEQKVDIKQALASMLLGAIDLDNSKAVKILINQGADIHYRFDEPLRKAVSENSHTAIQLLKAGVFKRSLLSSLISEAGGEVKTYIHKLLNTNECI